MSLLSNAQPARSLIVAQVQNLNRGCFLHDQQASAVYKLGPDAFAAAGERLQRYEAPPGSPLASARRGAASHSRTNSRSFDAAPGSPLAPRCPPAEAESDNLQQVWATLLPCHAHANRKNWHLLRRQELMLVSRGRRRQSDSNASVSRSSKWSSMTTLQAVGQLAGCKMD